MFSSIREMLQACQESRQPLYEVILESDLAESGLTRAESEAEMHRLWSVMRATSDGYCGADHPLQAAAAYCLRCCCRSGAPARLMKKLSAAPCMSPPVSARWSPAAPP